MTTESPNGEDVLSRRLLTPAQYEELLQVRRALAPGLADELMAQLADPALERVPSDQFLLMVLPNVRDVPFPLVGTIEEMERAIAPEADNIRGSWHALFKRGRLREMLERMRVSERWYKQQTGLELQAFTVSGAIAREERTVRALELSAQAAKDSAEAARAAAAESAKSASTAQRWQWVTVLVAVVAGVVVPVVLELSKRAQDADHQVDGHGRLGGMDAGVK
jgi:hypothetical protein